MRYCFPFGIKLIMWGNTMKPRLLPLVFYFKKKIIKYFYFFIMKYYNNGWYIYIIITTCKTEETEYC